VPISRWPFPLLLLCAAVPARASDTMAFWRGALDAADRTPPAVMEISPGHMAFSGPGGAPCHALKASAVALCSMAILHIQESQIGPAPAATAGVRDGFLHLYLSWLPGDSAPAPYTAAGLPDKTQYALYRSVQCATRALDIAPLCGETVSPKVGLVGEGLGGFAALVLAALRPDRVGFVLLHQPAPIYHFLPLSSAMRGVAKTGTPFDPKLLQLAGSRRWPESRLRLALGDFDGIALARQVRCPVLVVYNESDSRSPLSALNDLYGALAGPKDALRFDQPGRVPFAAVPDHAAIFAAFAHDAIAGQVARRIARSR
jgi:pimeloyl-ACP methyl ester carboxylesterase